MDLNYIYDNMCLEKYKSKFEYLQKIIGKNAKVILEIGGHYGEDTLRFYKYFPESKIYSFEPDPRNIQIFKKCCSKIDSIQLIEKAVSNKHNETILFNQAMNKDNNNIIQDKYNYIGIEDYKNLKLSGSGASSIKSINHENVEIYNVIEVKTVRLDLWAIDNNIDIIDFIWIDVQGAEKEVIEGLKNIIEKVRYIQLEYGETSYEGGLSKQETYNMMINNNFELVSDYNPNSLNGDFLFKRIYKE